MYRQILSALVLLVLSSIGQAQQTRFGQTLCNDPDYACHAVKSGETWDNLFPNMDEQDLVRRVNRMNIRLRPGMIIAVPRHLERLSIYDVSPFPRYIESSGEKTIYVSQKQLAFGAYDADGELLWWGPISPGIEYCPGVRGGCHTPTGYFRVIRKQDDSCVSTVFPRRSNGVNGGAQMPWCMHFFRGYALHGSSEVPGFPASHGCVRMFVEDARWLNEDFIDLPGGGGATGTRVIIDEPPASVGQVRRQWTSGR
ncbi:enhanced entry protein EnhA [Legionella geestiana]|uniref:Enhanced entry protein EnhA n=2 Tax=Legionella geestiana TaxID=45065 RepID=A0A0W0U868_9GAMM|nr:L,D-transpeptidase [Legionella geestiana]KTD04194.1 enhanced entry protein EnhA [Legionella geestiana]STX53702.1 enhanced entry protein EnhA [Legionella geestiana]